MPAPGTVSITRVDDSGIRATATEDLVVDVLFDGRRVWSFWVLRDSEAQGGQRFLAWPKRLRRFLDGHTRLELRTHVDDVVRYDAEHVFGTSTDRIAVVDAHARPVGIDNSGRLQRTFDTRDASQTAPLLDSIERILAALHDAGVEAFPAYGTLLGAVREGRLLGHDSDADLAYVSRHTVPVDVIRESFAIARRLSNMGYSIDRYSGAGIKVLVTEGDGSVRGLDVFGGFFDDGHLHVMGEIRVPFEEEWVFPLGTCNLEGRTLPAPANTDAFLNATYGPSWRVPDPAFAFATPATTFRRFNDWFRGTRVHRADWDRRYLSKRGKEPRRRPDTLARRLLRTEGHDISVVDVGCGRGESARWLALQGVPTLGLDFCPTAYQYLAGWAAGQPSLPLRFGMMNVLESRHVLGWGARLAHGGGTQVVMARHLADALTPSGRANLWRFARMACGPSGRLYVEFLTGAAQDDRWANRQLLQPLDPDVVERDVTAAGGTVVSRQEHSARPTGRNAGRDAILEQRRSCEMVVEWHR